MVVAGGWAKNNVIFLCIVDVGGTWEVVKLIRDLGMSLEKSSAHIMLCTVVIITTAVCMGGVRIVYVHMVQ